MTAQQILVMSCVYCGALVAVAYFTRATQRRIIGAVAGGTVAGALVMGVIVVADRQGWWRVPMPWTAGMHALVYLGFLVTGAPICLITWRVTRRFGERGLAVVIGVAALLGPPRDYVVAALSQEWLAFGPGVTPVLVVAATYAGVLALGHAVMRLVAGPSTEDLLAPRRWRVTAASRT